MPVLENVPQMRSLSSNETTQSLRLVAMGDSLIYGFGDPEGGGWVERLRRRWMSAHTPGHALYNLGVRGDGVTQVARRLEDEFRTRGELRHRVPDGMILSVGVNDSARVGKPTGRSMTSMDDFNREMAHLLDQAQSLCPVLFVGMIPIDVEKMPFSEILYYNHTDQYRYKQATHNACLQRGIPYLDIFDLWIARGEHWWRSHLSSDGLHPNISGYEALLDDVLSWEPMSSWFR